MSLVPWCLDSGLWTFSSSAGRICGNPSDVFRLLLIAVRINDDEYLLYGEAVESPGLPVEKCAMVTLPLSTPTEDVEIRILRATITADEVEELERGLD